MSETKRKRKPYSEISEEEKEYRKEWIKKNTAQVRITVNKKIKENFEKSCDILKVSQHSILKKAIDETIEKANQLEDENDV